MADLVARGISPGDRWRRTLLAGAQTLGRHPAKSTWVVPWDRQISGLHATLTWKDGQLHVRREPQSSNQIFFQGKPCEEFDVAVGEHFVIGETTFVVEESAELKGVDQPSPESEYTCSAEELRQHKYADPAERIEVLAALPEMIRYSPRDEELAEWAVSVLLRGIPRAEAAAVVWMNPAGSQSDPIVEMRHWDRRDQKSNPVQPSRRLIFDALQRRRQSVMHIWHAAGMPGEFTLNVAGTAREFTLQEEFDWAICAPMPDRPQPGWGVYVTGRLRKETAPTQGASRELLKDDVKFAEWVAGMFGALREVGDLQRRQGQLSRFFSPQVLAALARREVDEVLRPRETEVTVLFCDLRGSSRIAEAAQTELAGLWDRVSEALSIMTGGIIDQDGVIGDFQGDAAMGFWGWPLDTSDQVEKACRAALTIQRRFVREGKQRDHALANFTCGIGIAHGRAFVGRLGTPDQFKVGVFGHVVNLAARLESMTKTLQVPILMDEQVSERLRAAEHGHWARCRRVCRVQPYGMSAALMVSELLPPAFEQAETTDRDLRNYEGALAAFLDGRWREAHDLLRHVPHDRAAEFLKQFMQRYQLVPPTAWNRIIVLDTK